MHARRSRQAFGIALVMAALAVGCGSDDSSSASGDGASDRALTNTDTVDPADWTQDVCGGLETIGQDRADDLVAVFAAVPADFSTEAELATAVPALADAYRQTALLIGDYLDVIAEAGAPDVDDGRAFVLGVLRQLETAEDSMLDAVDRLDGLGSAPTFDDYQVVVTRLSDLAAAQQVLSLDIGTEGPAELAAAYEAEPACTRAGEIFAGLG